MTPWLLAAPWIAMLALILYGSARRSPRLLDYRPLTAGPRLSVIIPARNEAVNIEPCLRSILATAYAPLEVIVVDDRSSDATAKIVARVSATDPRVRLVRGADLPAGWFGKQWALVQGYRAATGALLLFADADTRHTAELIPRALAVLDAERVDLVTVLPRQEMGSFWERLVQPHVFLALQARVGELRLVNRTRRPWNAIANGQFILTPRAVYEEVGTHEAVRETVADDMLLAQRYVAARKDIFLVHGEEFMATRMYRSLGEIVAGWTKNLALGVPMMMPPVAVVRRAVPFLMWLPGLLWIAPPVAWLAWRSEFAAIAVAASVAAWIAIYRRQQAPLWYALLYPLGAAVVGFIMMRSAWRGGRRVEWRGRTYRVTASEAGGHIARQRDTDHDADGR